MSKIQSVMFKKRYYTVRTATKWLKKHNFMPIKPVDITLNYYRFRIREPIKSKNYRIITFKPGIKAVLQF